MSSTYQLDTAHPPRLVYLNSKQARYIEQDATYIWNLTENITLPKTHMFVISVVDAQIPYSFYLINNNNNRYYVNDQFYTIPQGNYNALELVEKLKANHPTFTFQYTETTNKLTISNSTPFSMANDPAFEPFLLMLGFRFDSYFGQRSYTSDSVLNLSGYNSLYIFSNVTSFAIDSYAKRGSNVLSKIPINTTSNGIIFYENRTMLKQVVNLQNLNEIKLQLLNNFYRPLHLNYIDFTITLQIEKVPATEESDSTLSAPPSTPIPIKKSKGRV